MQWSKDQTWRTLAFSIGWLLLLGWGRPPGNVRASGLPEEQFWATKIGWHHAADIVLLGDSRVMNALDPESMGQPLPGRRILNYAFDGCGFEPQYFSAAAQVLDPQAAQRCFVLGVSPRTLAPAAAAANGFLNLSRKHPAELWIARRFGSVVHYLRPYDPGNLIAFLSGERLAYMLKEEFHATGWVARTRDPEDTTAALARYRAFFATGQASPEVTAAVLKQVSAWSAAGIAVYGFHPPIGPEMIELEQEQSGFAALDFPQRFTQAGGRWIEVDNVAYHTIDGDHLRADSAEQFSRWLAQVIADDLP